MLDAQSRLAGRYADRLSVNVELPRQEDLDALAPETHQQVLIALPPNVLEVLPELRQQQERARQIQNEVRNRAMQEMQRIAPKVRVVPVIADIRDAAAVEQAMAGVQQVFRGHTQDVYGADLRFLLPAGR